MDIPPVDVNRVRQLRAALREILPSAQADFVSNETISACAGLLAEVVTLRTAREIKGLRGTDASKEEVVQMMHELTDRLSDAIREAVVKRVPDAMAWGIFREPRS